MSGIITTGLLLLLAGVLFGAGATGKLNPFRWISAYKAWKREEARKDLELKAEQQQQEDEAVRSLFSPQKTWER